MNPQFQKGNSYESNLPNIKFLSDKQRNECSNYLSILKEIEAAREKNKLDKRTEKHRNSTESFIQTFRNQLESNFKCPICQTLVTQPIILACSHLFCKICLDDWMTVVESRGDLRNCPICRKIVRENIADPSESCPTSSLQLFFRKIKELDKLFTHQQSIPEEDCLARLLDVLELPRSFSNLETMHILKNNHNRDQCPEDAFVKQSRLVGCVQLIRQLSAAEKDLFMKKVKVPKTGWQIFLHRVKSTGKLICPRWLPGTMSCVKDFIFQSPGSCPWEWGRPISLFYIWTFFSIIYFCIAFTFGPSVLQWIGLKYQAKRLMQHVIFICLDIPTFEIVNIVYEAFTTPL